MREEQFQELLESIRQMRAIHRGTRKPSRVFFKPMEVKKLRLHLGLTQFAFAAMLCISIGTLRNWEQGRTVPDGPALVLLRVAESNPKVLLETLHT